MLEILVFKPHKTTSKGMRGSLFKFNEDGKLIPYISPFFLNQSSDNSIRFAIMCQLLAEGHSVDSITQNTWSPTKYEFYLWIDRFDEYKVMYHKSLYIRSKGVIEKLYCMIEDSGKLQSEEELKEHLKILNQMVTALKKDVEDSDSMVMNIHVIDIESNRDKT